MAIKIVNGRIAQFYPANSKPVTKEKNKEASSNPDKFNVLLNLERLMRFALSVLPDDRSDLERMPLEQLLTSFKEAEYIYEKKKEAQRTS